jgi:hypothetical protein
VRGLELGDFDLDPFPFLDMGILYRQARGDKQYACSAHGTIGGSDLFIWTDVMFFAVWNRTFVPAE